jgi:hypothetical protein
MLEKYFYDNLNTQYKRSQWDYKTKLFSSENLIKEGENICFMDLLNSVCLSVASFLNKELFLMYQDELRGEFL